MNDVSILFPLPGSLAERNVAALAAGSTGSRGTLLPSKLYDAVGHVSGSTRPTEPVLDQNGEAAYTDLTVVAMRLDPCFAALAPDPHGTGCQNQLRLVMQEVTVRGDGEVYTFDSALHVFYSLTRDDLQAVAQGIAALRVASGHSDRLGPLAPHPVMVAEGLTGPTAAGVRALILGYAGAQNLTRITKLSSTDGGFLWQFGGFDVANTDPPAIASMLIPTLPNAATSQIFFRDFGADLNGSFTPVTTGPDVLTAVARSATAGQAVTADVASAVHAMARIENPALDSPDTVDSAGCHLATPLSRLVAGPDFGLSELADPAAFAVDGVAVLPSEVQATFDPAAPSLEVHAFSYVNREAIINQRTANETAAVVEYLNANGPSAWPAALVP